MAYRNDSQDVAPRPIPVTWIDLDPHFDSDNIFKLNVVNFKRYLSEKEKALVMFYDSTKCENPNLNTLLENVANASSNGKYGFGAVDCATDFPVCVRHSGCDTPMFKLYSNGYELSSLKDPTKINIDQIKMLMKMTPVLFQPRGSLGRNFSVLPSDSTESGKEFYSLLRKKLCSTSEQ